MMKRKVALLRLSPNEEARLMREEYERRRKLRIQQVREQQRDIALHIRREVEQRRQHELEQLGKELREAWECQQREKLNALQKLYQENLKLVGQGHRSAKENEPDLAAIAKKEEENHLKAEERYRGALQELKSQRLKEHERQNQSINARKLALQTEKERAAKVASLPPPQPSHIQPVIESKKPRVMKRFAGVFASTHYLMSENIVDREVDETQPNAHEGAEVEERRREDLQREEKKRREEQLEKACLRGKLALKREHLEQDRERLLVELEHMQQTDLLRRRQRVSQMPPQIFQPLYKKQEAREDFQREIEFAFEDMYTGERRVKGDLVVQLVPEPLPALSTASQDQELDVTLDEVSTPVKENLEAGIEQESVDTQEETSAQVHSSRAAPRKTLKKLLERVRSQRNEWTEHSNQVSGADSPTAITNQIPEQDTTIDTGSLTSTEKDSQPTVEPPEPSHPTPALDITKKPTAANVLLPDVPTDVIQKLTQEGKKREEELKKEMQQQVALLQELEEQRAKLEQVLLEAQHERENLKAAVIQEVPVHQPEEPALDQEVTAGVATKLMTPPDEQIHSRKIREYQERLLEQNRNHQRSVEVARQRLEEYQRALQTRYSMNSAAALPGVAPLHGARSVHPPTARSRPTTPGMPPCFPAKQNTPLEMPTRDSGTLSSPPQPSVSSFREGSSMQRHEEDSISKCPGGQILVESAWLTDGIMERVTKHLPERVRPLSVSREPPHDKSFPPSQLASFPLQPTSDPIQAIDTEVKDVTPLAPGHTAVIGRTTDSLTSSEDDMERKRQKLEQAQRWVLEQREAVALQQRRQEEERKRLEVELEQIRQQKERLKALIQTDAQVREGTIMGQGHHPERGRPFSITREPLHHKLFPTHETTSIPLQPTSDPSYTFSPTITDVTPLVPANAAGMGLTSLDQPVLTGSLGSGEACMQRYAQELQQAHKGVPEQKEAVALQREEQRKRLEAEEQQMRTQENLQTVIQTDVQPAPEDSSAASVSENIGQARLKLLASLLRSIEENYGGTLSHLEEPQEEDVSAQQTPLNKEEPAQDPIPQNNVPAGPLAVLPSGFLLPPRAVKPPITRVRLSTAEMLTDQHELSAIPEVETPVNTSQVIEDDVKVLCHSVDWDTQDESRSTVSDTTLQTPSLSSRGRPYTPSVTDSSSDTSFIWRKRLLLGAETPSQFSEPDSKLMSSLSSDSGRGGDCSGPAVTSYRSPTESAHRPPDPDCLSSSTISTGSYITTDPEQNLNADKSTSLTCVEQGQEADLLNVSSPSVKSLVFKDSSAAGSPGQAIGALFSDSSIQSIIDRYTKELNISLGSTGKPTDSGYSYVEESGPAVSQLSVGDSDRREEDESSVRRSLPSDTAGTQRSDLEWVRTVSPALENFSDKEPSLADGQEQNSFRPLIGQPADQSSCLGTDHRDPSAAQAFGQPSAHFSAIGQLPGQPVSVSLDQGGWDSTLSRMMSRLSQQSGSHWLSGGRDDDAGQVAEQSTTWLDGGHEESQMRALVGEWDESAAQHSGSSGEGTRVDLGVSTETNAPSNSETSPLSGSVPDVDPEPQDQTLMDLCTERTEGADSFHPLLAEVTHNETLEPSMTFHVPENNVPDSPKGQSSRSDHNVPTAAEESEPNNNLSESDQSLEQLRMEEPSSHGTVSSTLHESVSQLIASRYHPNKFVFAVSPTLRTEVEQSALSLSNLTMCDATPNVSMLLPEEPFSAGDQKSEPGCSHTSVNPESEKLSVQLNCVLSITPRLSGSCKCKGDPGAV
ncbi:centrosomal protein of 295 kDa isoform X2 [Antennarius striatus]|uniref:centrosomal protein of 295 kDa isoform X2 n=1 Tax=Antennarius striatus TaxID=241820 RepID=UPI0035AF88A4